MTDKNSEVPQPIAPVVHDLKIWPEWFQQIVIGAKRFDIRKNDRNFRGGDTLWLREWVPNPNGSPAQGTYSGRTMSVRVMGIYVEMPGVLPDHVVLLIG